MDETWIALDIGCAECGNWPLAGVLGVYGSIEEAAAATEDSAGYEWREHPQGGFVKTQGNGGTWVVSLALLAQPKRLSPWEVDERDAARITRPA